MTTISPAGREASDFPLPYRYRAAGRIESDRAAVFAYLDSHARLVRHMEERNWRMGWGSMKAEVDEGEGRRPGSHIRMSGRVFGIPLAVDEVVEIHDPPVRKQWATVGEPRLLVVGPYRMRFTLAEAAAPRPATELEVEIEYAEPAAGISRLLFRLLGRRYARWCTTRMVADAQAAAPTTDRSSRSPVPAEHVMM